MSIEEFITLLINSRLSNRYEAQKTSQIFEEACRNSNAEFTVDSLCDFLIATNRITAWQCDKLRQGKWKGFYLDNYLLLEHVGKDYEHSYYKARDARDGQLVRLAITPMNRSKGPDIEYRVEPYAD